MTLGLGRSRWARALALTLGAVAVAAGCSAQASVSAAHGPAPAASPGPVHTSARTSAPTRAFTPPVTPPAVRASAGPDTPSATELTVCSAQLAQQISALLGEQPSRTQAGSWSARVYSCQYSYRDGGFTLAVRESPGQAATDAVFAAQRRAAGPTSAQAGLGQQAFTEPDGTVVLRDGFDVLTVGAGTLPAAPGYPPRPRAAALHMIAETVLSAWQQSQA